ncbi:MAG TPA: arginine--tRNA ligase [Candidatus Nanoarchaeia archaeon]|nr:arginine--tRNA ligase [Candidatus Nanoarchaeia archaeon]
MDYKEKIVQLLSKATGLAAPELHNLIKPTPNPQLGEYAFPCFKLGKNPHQEAEKLKQKLVLPSYISKVEVAGPYLNFFLNQATLASNTITAILKQKQKYGRGKAKENIVVEFCSPNTNKPLHLGHIRNICLGDATVRLLRFQGNNVHPVEVINDRGVHICKSMLAYARWGKNQQPTKKTDHFIGDYYVLFAQKAQQNPALEEEAQQMLLAWEKGDTKTKALWKKMNGWAVKGIKQTYARLGIVF